VLGKGFLAIDLVRYATGVSARAVFDGIVLRRLSDD
jgi:hypothetical protein